MNRAFLLLALIVGVDILAAAQEAVTLTTPIVSTTTAQHVGYIGLDLDNNRIAVQVENQANVVTAIKVYDGTTTPTGAALLRQLNTGNFTATSLIRAVYTRLTTDSIIPAGAVTGTPQ